MYPIPANATRIRYLGVSGNAYIMSGVTLADDQSARIKVRSGLTAYGSNAVICGALQTAAGSTPQINCTIASDTAGNYRAILANKNNATTSLDSGGNLATGLHDFDLSWDPATSKATFVVDGERITTQILAEPIFPPLEIRIFGRNNGTGTNILLNANQRVAACDIWQNGTLVRSFVPVRVGQTGYLFDRVSGQLFGNAGTGAFVFGPDVFKQGVVPTRMMVAGVRKKLPYDKDIEYIEISGDGAYINTGVIPQNSPSAVLRAQYLGTSQSSAQTTPLFGRRNFSSPNKHFAFWVRSDTLKMAVNWGTYDTGWQSQTTDKTAFHDYALNSSGGYFDGANFVSVASGGSIGDWTDVPLGIGCVVQSGGASALETRGVKLRVASFQLYNGGVIAFDGIPVRVGTVGYLYDKVTKTLFGNAGTGSFVLGPDK